MGLVKNIITVFTVGTILNLFFSFNSTAQISLGVRPYSNDTRLGLGLSVGKPTTYAYSSAIEADLRWQKDFSPYVSGLLNIGYTRFLRNGNILESEFADNAGFLPVKAGVKIFALEKVYISGEFGAAFNTVASQPASFVYAPGLGYEFNSGLDLGLRYESFSRYEIAKIAIKIAYGFSLSRQTGYTF